MCFSKSISSKLVRLIMDQIKLEELKAKSPTELLAFAETHEIENASAMLKQDMLYAI